MTSEARKPVLVVDLDGTLLRSDILFETFWSALGKNWQTLFKSASALSHSKARLKHELAEAGPVDVETLPYDPEVIAYVEDWRRKGAVIRLW